MKHQDRTINAQAEKLFPQNQKLTVGIVVKRAMSFKNANVFKRESSVTSAV